MWNSRIRGQHVRQTDTAARPDAEFNLVHRMCEVIRHRGPDDEGIHVEPGVGLGMRRLSIIDLAGGRQPIHNETEHDLGRLQRRDLQLSRAARASSSRSATASTRRATPRRSSTPTSSGARTPSAGCAACSASRCGIAPTRTLLLARDRAGQKPLHYAERGGRLYFGSEIKSLLAAGAVEPTLNLARARSLPRVPLHAARHVDLRRRPQAAARPLPALARRPRRGPPVLAGRRAGDRSPGTRSGGGRGAAARCCRTPSARTWSATCRSARSSRAASIPRRSSA